MFGPPSDKSGECNARLFISDDYGDNTATFRCQLTPKHKGCHTEKFTYDGNNPVVITWERGETE